MPFKMYHYHYGQIKWLNAHLWARNFVSFTKFGESIKSEMLNCMDDVKVF